MYLRIIFFIALTTKCYSAQTSLEDYSFEIFKMNYVNDHSKNSQLSLKMSLMRDIEKIEFNGPNLDSTNEQLIFLYNYLREIYNCPHISHTDQINKKWLSTIDYEVWKSEFKQAIQLQIIYPKYYLKLEIAIKILKYIKDLESFIINQKNPIHHQCPAFPSACPQKNLIFSVNLHNLELETKSYECCLLKREILYLYSYLESLDARARIVPSLEEIDLEWLFSIKSARGERFKLFVKPFAAILCIITTAKILLSKKITLAFHAHIE